MPGFHCVLATMPSGAAAFSPTTSTRVGPSSGTETVPTGATQVRIRVQAGGGTGGSGDGIDAGAGGGGGGARQYTVACAGGETMTYNAGNAGAQSTVTGTLTGDASVSITCNAGGTGTNYPSGIPGGSGGTSSGDGTGTNGFTGDTTAGGSAGGLGGCDVAGWLGFEGKGVGGNGDAFSNVDGEVGQIEFYYT